jgi:type I restriction enzyme S subunit
METIQMNKVKKLVPELRFKEFDGEFEYKKLGDVSNVIMGQSPDSKSYNENGEGYYLIQGNADIKNRISSPRQWTTMPTKICEKGDIILTVRAPVGAIAKSIHNACIGRGVCVIRNLENNDSEFIYQFLLDFETKWGNIEQGSTFTAVSGSDIKSIKLSIPSLPEQQKIASFLSAVDEKIQQLTRKKELLEQYKKGVMQQLFSGELRFKDDNGKKYPDWEEKRLGEVFDHRNETGFNDLELLSISIRRGVYSQTESNKIDNSNNDKSKYKRILKGDIGYNSMRMWQGASAVSSLEGIISPAYTVLKRNVNNSSEFFGFLFKMSKMIQLFQKHSQGLTSDTWNLKYPMLSRIKVMRPSLTEQQKIANFLSSLDSKIECTTQQITQTQTFKKGLLQKMFV